jgi:hypothetical protein
MMRVPGKPSAVLLPVNLKILKYPHRRKNYRRTAHFHFTKENIWWNDSLGTTAVDEHSRR